MALEKNTIVDKIETVKSAKGDWYVLQVREVIEVKEGDEIISSSFHRYTLQPDHDTSTITNPTVKAQFEAIMGNKEKENFSNYNKELEKDRLAREAKEQETK